MKNYQEAAARAAKDAVNRVAAELECDSAEVREPVRRILSALGLDLETRAGARSLSKYRSKEQRAELCNSVLAGIDQI